MLFEFLKFVTVMRVPYRKRDEGLDIDCFQQIFGGSCSSAQLLLDFASAYLLHQFDCDQAVVPLFSHALLIANEEVTAPESRFFVLLVCLNVEDNVIFVLFW